MDNEEKKYYFDLKHVPLESEREENRIKRGKMIRKIISYLFVLLIGIALGLALYTRIYVPDKNDPSTTIKELENYFSKEWLYRADYEDLKTTLEDKAFYGMTTFDEDPYTSFMSKKEMQEFATSINRDYVGIGVSYTSEHGIPIVVRVFKDSPAEKAGLLPGDLIIKVDGIEMNEETIENIKEYVTGESGTEVIISVQRGSEFLDISVIRAAINSSVYSYVEDDYVYLKIDSFGLYTADEIEANIGEYTDYHKLIIDLRDDTGGYQSAVRDCLRLFIGANKQYLLQEDVNGVRKYDYTREGTTFTNFDKIAIITNDHTASAAEVFALVMKEEVEGTTLVGETTFGKGVIQTNKQLSNGGVLKLTTYYWYSPKGTSINNEGVKPDYEVKMPSVYYEYYTIMDEDEKYEYDSVSSYVRISQISLDYLDYELERQDGYFDKSFEEALKKFQADNNLEVNGVLDEVTYNAIISKTRFELTSNDDKDTQLAKAVEVLHED